MPLTKIQSLGITDGTIVNADINASAAIAGNKLSGAGKVLQVVTTANGTGFSTSSTSYQDAISASITPSSASNKILILGHSGSLDANTASDIISVTLFRDATDLASASHFATLRYESSNANGNISFNHLDSPSTTSSTTYTFKFKRALGSGTVFFNNGGSNRIILMEIAAWYYKKQY